MLYEPAALTPAKFYERQAQNLFLHALQLTEVVLGSVQMTLHPVLAALREVGHGLTDQALVDKKWSENPVLAVILLSLQLGAHANVFGERLMPVLRLGLKILFQLLDILSEKTELRSSLASYLLQLYPFSRALRVLMANADSAASAGLGSHMVPPDICALAKDMVESLESIADNSVFVVAAQNEAVRRNFETLFPNRQNALRAHHSYY